MADMNSFYKNKKILITGGTGSLGDMIGFLLKDTGAEIFMLSRDEYKQWYMKNRLDNKRNHKYILGDIRDNYIDKYFKDIDIVFHTAALKHIDFVENNPEFSYDVNVNGTNNILNICIRNKIKHFLYVSTDKACIPTNTYGSTKLTAERLTINSNLINGITLCSAIRLGNIFASRGSVCHIFNEILTKHKNPKLIIFNKSMTRFTITCKNAAQECLKVPLLSPGGCIYIPKFEKYNILTLAKAFIEVYLDKDINNSNLLDNIQYKKLRVSEKIHEDLIYKYEFVKVQDNESYYLAFTKDNDLKSNLINCFNYCSSDAKEINYSKLKNDIQEFKKLKEFKSIIW